VLDLDKYIFPWQRCCFGVSCLRLESSCIRVNMVLSSVDSMALPYHTFPHYLINTMIFRKKLLNIKCVCCFSLQLLSETFLILRRNE